MKPIAQSQIREVWNIKKNMDQATTKSDFAELRADAKNDDAVGYWNGDENVVGVLRNRLEVSASNFAGQRAYAKNDDAVGYWHDDENVVGAATLINNENVVGAATLTSTYFGRLDSDYVETKKISFEKDASRVYRNQTENLAKLSSSDSTTKSVDNSGVILCDDNIVYRASNDEAENARIRDTDYTVYVSDFSGKASLSKSTQEELSRLNIVTNASNKGAVTQTLDDKTSDYWTVSKLENTENNQTTKDTTVLTSVYKSQQITKLTDADSNVSKLVRFDTTSNEARPANDATLVKALYSAGVDNSTGTSLLDTSNTTYDYANSKIKDTRITDSRIQGSDYYISDVWNADEMAIRKSTYTSKVTEISATSSYQNVLKYSPVGDYLIYDAQNNTTSTIADITSYAGCTNNMVTSVKTNMTGTSLEDLAGYSTNTAAITITGAITGTDVSNARAKVTL